ncbi:D-2-hydroxyacid dehydrogenase [Geomonas sp. RF6]|uniref:NAD(P)-dependent oxidoreductase n=1 Tax=Geomonas sp. RF6 TaxID=2897342 RepID=UPI001E2DEC00|nr:NAD(P)-dependent oxidoreductase [Geomonas sp. RF6]UFS70349.1 D-2-hydroxyacid dehydrogenase [Geomonas sp. RF6]
MSTIVFLNSRKLDFDGKLDFSPLDQLGTFTRHDSSVDGEIIKNVQGQEVVITKELPVGEELIARFPSSVKLICEAGTGYNNIDIVVARKRGIAVCNVPNYSTEAVAQMAITFILNLSCSLVQQQIMLQRGDFHNFTHELQVPHFEVHGKTLGIIGGGAIGGHTMKLALALGMHILVNQRTPKVSDDPRVRFVSFEEVMKKSDFVSIHCPLTAQTRHLINRESLALMRPTAYIINTSRGGIINEADLIEALRNGTIAGAGLDVQEQEPPETDNPLFAMDNVIMTPHIGWKRLETRQRLVKLTADNIAAFLAESPLNVVN